MKLFAKIGLVTLLGGAGVVFVSANVAASNAEAHADFSVIQKARAVAKAENDLIKLNCINDKLVLANGLLNIIDGGDTTKLSELHELRVAAEACAGKTRVKGEGGWNTFTGPPGATEPNDPGLDWGTTFEPGVNASPSTP